MPEGPFRDLTRYCNNVEELRFTTVIKMKKNPIYLRTYIGKPPDKPSILSSLKKMGVVMWHDIKLATLPLLSQALLHTSTNK